MQVVVEVTDFDLSAGVAQPSRLRVVYLDEIATLAEVFRGEQLLAAQRYPEWDAAALRLAEKLFLVMLQ